MLDNKPLMIFVKPVEGRRVRDPSTLQLLPAEGDSKAAISFWYRRIADGDVTLVESTEAASEPLITEAKQKRSAKSDESKGS